MELYQYPEEIALQFSASRVVEKEREILSDV